MIIFIIILHILICIALIGIVLIQRGRGGGLVESFSGVESMFGTKTSAFLTRITTVLSVLFFITCLSLAAISLKQSRSLMRDIKTEEEQGLGQVPIKIEESPEAKEQIPQAGEQAEKQATKEETQQLEEVQKPVQEEKAQGVKGATEAE